MSPWTKFATKFYQQQKKKNPDYKFSQALKDAAKAYKKRGGGDKVGGDDDKPITGEEDDDKPITGEEEAITAIDKCKTKEELEDVISRIEKGDMLNKNIKVEDAAKKKMEDIKNAIGSSEVEDITRESEVKNPASEIGSSEVVNPSVDLTKVDLTEVVDDLPEGEVIDEPKIGGKKGKKGKKSVKKGKKSTKKGGKKGKKSAKKSRR
jgi:hypothetical protein